LKAIEPDADERQLIEAARRDPSRFAELYEANFDRVYDFIARRVPTREEADDLTADVFRQALSSLPSFEWQGMPFAGWLLGIATHLIARRWQRAAKQTALPVEALESVGVPEQTERRAIFSQLVERLPEDQRYVVRRRFIDHRSIREIAQELGRSVGAIKQLQFRALETLRMQVRSRHE
jgi:RNA polymerase sigma-70 factor (ECF subfamily)